MSVSDILRRPYLYLLAFLLLSFLLVPLAAGGPRYGVALDLLFYVVVIAGLRAIRRSLFSRTLTVLAPFYIAVDVLGGLLEVPWLMAASCIFGALFLLGVCASILHAIQDARRISSDIVMGGVCVFLLLGLLWYQIYVAMYLLDPGSFDYTAHAVEKGLYKIGILLFYYSYSCLITSGFGDILPMNAWGQCLSVLEGVAGQLFLVVFIARLVGLKPRGAAETEPQHTVSKLD